MEDYKHKYEQALENLKKIRNSNKNNKELVDFIEYNYPELKESEDERIRKELINFFSKGAEYDSSTNGIKDRNIVAWLEKQDIKLQEYIDEARNKKDFYCEGKEMSWNDMSINVRKHDYPYYFKGDLDCYPFNIEKQKVEPKFKVGDWITDGIITFQIAGIEDEWYIADDHSTLNFSLVNQDYRLWTIKDAKDGDILSSGYSNPFIFSGFLNNNVVGSYCGITRGGNFHIPQFKDNWTVRPVFPATKEQRKLLFQKMKEAGYEWDAKKKELKKIEQKPAFCHHEVDLSGCSEEYRKAYYDGWNNCNQQHSQLKAEQKPVWSKEDKKLLNLSLENLTELKNRFGEKYGKVGDCILWLKSLKERYGWKPTDELMKQLGWVAEQNKDNMIGKELMSLYQELKKLKGE